jgi:hypothetical protein
LLADLLFSGHKCFLVLLPGIHLTENTPAKDVGAEVGTHNKIIAEHAEESSLQENAKKGRTIDKTETQRGML